MSAIPQLEAVPQLFIVFTLASLTIRGKSCGAPGIKNFPRLNWTELNWNRNFEGRYRKIIKNQYFSSRSSPKVLFYVFSHSPFVGPRCGSTTVLFDEHYVRHDFYGYTINAQHLHGRRTDISSLLADPGHVLPRFFLTTTLSLTVVPSIQIKDTLRNQAA